MVTKIRVVNDCLAIMGEAPLNVLAEDHAFKEAALSTLDRVSSTVQSRSWWYNMETLELTASPVDFRVYLPNDLGTLLPTHANMNLAQRGRVVYDLDRGTDRFPEGFTCTVRLTRKLEIEDVPESVAELIAARTVQEFQNLYDGDQTKTRNLSEAVQSRSIDANSEHIRNRRVNLVNTSERLYRVTSRINYSRRPY